MNRPNRTVRAEDSGVVQALEPRDLSLEETLGKYRLLGTLGHGGMADVYLAMADGPEGFRKLCVLKTLKDSMAQDEDFRAMFLDEARLAARLNHPNVVQTFEIDDSEGRLLLAMEYVEGQPVTRVRRRLTPEQFPLTAYIRVLCDVLDALDYAHNLSDFDGSRLGVVHRDVTPHNILVGYDGRVKLVDFGIAKSSAAVQMTQAGVLKGKVGYMAPEQAGLGEVDGRADVFSVGVILWEAIAGKRLAEGLSARDVLTRRIEGKDPKIADIVPEVDPELAAICDRAMVKKVSDRFATASDLQIELEKWLKKHGEPPRKVWSQALKDAFAPERKQLRDIVEQRMTADGSLSGMRHALLAMTGPNAAKLSNSGESSVTSRKAVNTTPGDGVAANQAPNQAPKPGGGTGSISIHESVSFPARSVSLDPGLTPRRTSLPMVLGIAAIVATLVGVAAFALRSKQTVASSDSSSAHVGAQPPPTTTFAPVPSAAHVDPVATQAGSVAASAAPPQHGRPVYYAPQGGKPGTAVPSASHVAAPPVTPPPTTPTTKSTSRPLDDKDPYAP